MAKNEINTLIGGFTKNGSLYVKRGPSFTAQMCPFVDKERVASHWVETGACCGYCPRLGEPTYTESGLGEPIHAPGPADIMVCGTLIHFTNFTDERE